MLEDWETNLFSYFDDFVIIFGKDKVIGEGAETVADAVEEDNDEDEEFLDSTKNYHDEHREKREEENKEDIDVSTCNTIAATSKRN